MKIKKIIFILLISFVMMILFSRYIYASDYTTNYSIVDTGKEWIKTGESENDTFNPKTTNNNLQELSGLLMGIGIFIAVAVGIILGMKFMFSTAEGKAEVSKLLVPYIVGVVVVVGALAIWKLAIETFDVF